MAEELKIHHPDPIQLVRECCMLTKFNPDPNFPGHLVSWLSTWLVVWYRSGMVCAYPRRVPLLFPVGMGGTGTIGGAWIKQEVRSKGEALVDDLLCLGITGGVKLRRSRPVKLPKETATCVMGGHATTCRCNSGLPRVRTERVSYWRAATQIEFITPAQVKVGGPLYAPNREDRVQIGIEVRARRANGKIVEALHPTKG